MLIPAEESGRRVITEITAARQVVIVKQDPIKYTHAYTDIAGVSTVCDGLTRGVTRRTVMTPQQCDDVMEAELAATATKVQACTPLDSAKYGYQLIAYVDFSYNLGTGAWCNSAAAHKVRIGSVVASCDLLLRYNKARVHGRLVPVADLTRRRKREQAYCQTGLVPGSTAGNLAARLKGL